MSSKTRKNIIILSAIILLCITALTSTTTASAIRVWTGEPDPYDCNVYLDCAYTMKVCINENTHEVGYYLDPATRTNEEMEDDAIAWSGTELTIGKCEFNYTGRWIHTYVGQTWTCNLVSEAGEDKHDPRFSNKEYVKQTCGEHELFGTFEGSAEYKLCREKHSNGVYYCGNHYDTSY